MIPMHNGKNKNHAITQANGSLHTDEIEEYRQTKYR